MRIFTFFLTSLLPLLPAVKPRETQMLTSQPSAQLLMESTWHLTNWQTITGADTLNRRALLRPCQRDDRFNFAPTGVFVRTEGPSACPGSQPRATVSMRSWSLDATGTKLTLGAGGAGTVRATYDIVLLNLDALQLRYTRVVEGVAVTELLSYLN